MKLTFLFIIAASFIALYAAYESLKQYLRQVEEDQRLGLLQYDNSMWYDLGRGM
jgi:hypothetical protein